jgi:transcriptional regulatory protein CAT8
MSLIKVEPLDFGFGVEPKPRPKARPKQRASGQTTNTKTIKAPGSSSERVAQACDRCRAKKTKCDGKNPCSSCLTVGIECIVSDKLSRRAFPKGYTETLEERIRQLEAENKKLTTILDMRDEQVGLLEKKPLTTAMNGANVDDPLNQLITSSNLSRLQDQYKSHTHTHADGQPCGCSNSLGFHERPVSIAGSFYDENDPVSIAGSINLSDEDERNSLLSIDDYSQLHPVGFNRQNHKELTPAPGAWQAATAIAQMQKANKLPTNPGHQLDLESKQQLLTSLVSVSIPRSSEETLFIPTLLARICQAYGYSSKSAVLTANALASLKENIKIKSTSDNKNNQFLSSLIMNRNEIVRLDDNEAMFFVRDLIELPSKVDLDHFITLYLQDWGNALPILDKNMLLKGYTKLARVLDGESPSNQGESTYDLIEKFGAIMVLVVSLGLLSIKNSQMTSSQPGSEKYVNNLNHYDYLIHEFIKPSCIITKNCSIQSLQILALALQYCQAVGDISTCYELRGRVITMAQQLRLHRCPAAVLGIGGSNDDVDVQNFIQGERRILFWCVYCLDIYSSLNLGVPRLLKDFEVECAMPFAGKNDDDDDDNVNILVVNNTKLPIRGKVTKFALANMNYCKALGNILDTIYTRYESEDARATALLRDRMLDCWRRELPVGLKFEIDTNGFSLRDGGDGFDDAIWAKYNKQQLTLIFIYYHAKILIYLPIISKYGNHHNVGLSAKEKLTKGESDISSVISSVTMIQQSSIQMLEVLKCISRNTTSNILPIPINIVRQQGRIALLVAKGTLDYVKGGALYQNLRQLLLDTISFWKHESFEIPGALTKKSVRLLEWSILSILGVNLAKVNNTTKKRIPSNQPITKTAVPRAGYGNEIHSNAAFAKGLSNQGVLPSPLRSTVVAMSEEKDTASTNLTFTDDVDINNGSNSDDNEGLDSILDFDPFKVDLNRQILNEFGADGSLGLGPYLELNQLGYDNNITHFESNGTVDPQSMTPQYHQSEQPANGQQLFWLQNS